MGKTMKMKIYDKPNALGEKRKNSLVFKSKFLLFYPEDGGSKFFRNICSNLHNATLNKSVLRRENLKNRTSCRPVRTSGIF